MSDARRILNFLFRNRRRISPLLILTHDYPDPDSLASAFALRHLAQKNYGIRCRIVYGGVIGRMENRETARKTQFHPVFREKITKGERT